MALRSRDTLFKAPDILFVCLGNICRSPLAEGISRAKLDARGERVEVASCGTGRWHIGEAPDPGSVAAARRKGLDISSQRARHLSEFLLEEIPLIITMDQQNLRDVRAALGASRSREGLWLLRQFEPETGVKLPRPVSETAGVFDPYGSGPDRFDEVYQQVERCCETLIEWRSQFMA